MAIWAEFDAPNGDKLLVWNDPGATIRQAYINQFKTAFNLNSNNVLSQRLDGKTGLQTNKFLSDGAQNIGALPTGDFDWTQALPGMAGYILQVSSVICLNAPTGVWHVFL